MTTSPDTDDEVRAFVRRLFADPDAPETETEEPADTDDPDARSNQTADMREVAHQIFNR